MAGHPPLLAVITSEGWIQRDGRKRSPFILYTFLSHGPVTKSMYYFYDYHPLAPYKSFILTLTAAFSEFMLLLGSENPATRVRKDYFVFKI